MPCSDGGPTVQQQNETRDNQVIKGLRKYVKELEVMLCSACTSLEEKKFKFSANPQLDDWWDTHKKEDAKREEQAAKAEFRRKRAIQAAKLPVDKLTPEIITLLKEEGYL